MLHAKYSTIAPTRVTTFPGTLYQHAAGIAASAWLDALGGPGDRARQRRGALAAYGLEQVRMHTLRHLASVQSFHLLPVLWDHSCYLHQETVQWAQ